MYQYKINQNLSNGSSASYILFTLISTLGEHHNRFIVDIVTIKMTLFVPQWGHFIYFGLWPLWPLWVRASISNSFVDDV